MGIDPGTANLGFGVVRIEGGHMVALDGGVIETASSDPLEQRLSEIHSALSRLIKWHQPVALAIEDLYFGKNIGSAMRVGQASGVAMLAAAQGEHRLLRLHAAGHQVVGLRVRQRGQAPGPEDGRDQAQPFRTTTTGPCG